MPPTRTRLRGVLTTRGRAFMAAGLTLLAGGLLLGFGDITRVGVLLAALPLLAGLMVRRTSVGIVVTRTVQPARLVADQSASVAVLIQNATGRRTRLQLAEEDVHIVLGERPRFVLPAMEPDDLREVEYTIRCQLRGRYRLGPLTVRKQDPYGLATMTASLSGSTDILVLPRVEILGHGRPPTDGIEGEGTIPHMVALHSEDDAAVRSYRDGDDLRRIHWPATAHRSELMVRQEDHPARRRAVIVLDSRMAGHQGSAAAGSFEWAVTAAASIATHLSAKQYTLHLASSETAAEGSPLIPVEVDDAMTSLATAQLGDTLQFDEVLRWAHPLTLAGGLVVAIVADHDEDALRRIATLRQAEGTGLLIMLDTASFARPRPGPPSTPSQKLADMVSAAGWSTCVVTSGMTAAQAWSVVSARSALTVGTGR